MSIINEELNLMAANVLSYYVKMSLLQNRSYIENNEKGAISATEALDRLENVKSRAEMYGYPVEISVEYRELCKTCEGSIHFTDAEIDEIAGAVKKSVEVCGLEHNKNYWDVIAFAVRSLSRVAEYESFTSESRILNDSDCRLARKWKDCLQLVAMPIFYKPFACVIQCGNPYSVLRIANDENRTLYDLSNSLEVRTNELSEEMLLNASFQRLPNRLGDAEVAIDVAVNWWACALTDATYALRYYSSPSFMSASLALAISRYQTMPTDKEIEVFKECLAEEIRAGITVNGHYSISTNTELDPVLDLAIQKAGIGVLNFDWETTMDISPDQVCVSLGRNGCSRQVLFDANKAVKKETIQKKKV